MQTKAQRIVKIIGDYENNTISVEHILDWANQFEEADRSFILDELATIFEKSYLSKDQCINLIKKYIIFWTNHFKYPSVHAFLLETKFLDLQAPEKSQKELLAFLNDIVTTSYGISLEKCGRNPKHYIYLDDVLSTGNTVYRQVEGWLNTQNETNPQKSNYEHIKHNGLTLHICLLCAHTWGKDNVEYRFMKAFGNDVKKHIKYQWYYLVENNIKAYNPKLNHLLPIDNQTPEIQQYLASLDFATAHEDRAYRKTTQPTAEILFSSQTSRIRLENIFLKKGIEILSRVQNLRVQQLRPLGYTIKSHKTFGLGTLFFTYRNIPNNCPIVFWWANNNWKPLFALKNRGNN